MGRSGICEDCDGEYWDMIRWAGAVKSAIRGKRGQVLLRDLLAALDAMPDKRLIAEELKDAEGQVCALGALGVKRGLEVEKLAPDNHPQLAAAFDCAQALIREIEYMNDDSWWSRTRETPEARFLRMREWVATQLREAAGPRPGRET